MATQHLPVRQGARALPIALGVCRGHQTAEVSQASIDGIFLRNNLIVVRCLYLYMQYSVCIKTFTAERGPSGYTTWLHPSCCAFASTPTGSCLVALLRLKHHHHWILRTSHGATAVDDDKCHDQNNNCVVVAVMVVAFWRLLKGILTMSCWEGR